MLLPSELYVLFSNIAFCVVNVVPQRKDFCIKLFLELCAWGIILHGNCEDTQWKTWKVTFFPARVIYLLTFILLFV